MDESLAGLTITKCGSYCGRLVTAHFAKFYKNQLHWKWSKNQAWIVGANLNKEMFYILQN